MAIRSVCGLVTVVTSRVSPISASSARCFHMNNVQSRHSMLAERFSEVFSANPHPPPDDINSLMNLIHTQALRNTVTPFNLYCRNTTDRWSIKGLRIGAKEMSARKRHVILVSGMQANERIPIGVNLYVAAELSRCPIEDVEVTVFPVMKPKEYELNWRNEAVNRATGSSLSGGMVQLPSRNFESGVEGPLRSYVMKRGINFVEAGMELSASGSRLQIKNDSFSRLHERTNVIKDNLIAGVGAHASIHERTLFSAMVAPPAVVLELRDRHKMLCEDQISSCGDEVLSAIQKLVAETAPRNFAL